MPDNTQADDLDTLLLATHAGNEQALKEVFALVYDELRKSARIQLAKHQDCSLQATDLVNEAYARIVRQKKLDPENRSHFMALSVIVIKHKLLDHLKKKKAFKAGGGKVQVTLDSGVAAVPQANVDLLALDEALEKLRALSPRQARVVELRYFAGRSIEETAADLGVSPATVKTDWTAARAFLWSLLNTPDDDS